MAMRQNIDLSKMNPVVLEAIQEVMGHMPAPCSHGAFNRRMFLEAFVANAGSGVGIAPEDIMEYGNITEKEFPIILREFIAKGVVVKEPNLFGVEMYKLNMKATP